MTSMLLRIWICAFSDIGEQRQPACLIRRRRATEFRQVHAFQVPAGSSPRLPPVSLTGRSANPTPETHCLSD